MGVSAVYLNVCGLPGFECLDTNRLLVQILQALNENAKCLMTIHKKFVSYGAYLVYGGFKWRYSGVIVKFSCVMGCSGVIVIFSGVMGCSGV